MKDVSVIILNYNSSDYTLKCVDSIKRNTGSSIDYDIVIVDNNSTTDEYQKLLSLEKETKVKLVRTNINLGFSGGNTYGMDFCQSKYVFFLNNDCELLNDNISILYDFIEHNEKVGLCAGQMYDPMKKMMKSINYLPSLSLKLFGNSAMRFFKPCDYPDYKIEYNEPVKVPCLAGAAMFFDRQKFIDAGGFDPNYFLYCEEEDIAQAFYNIGHETYLVPEAKYIHHLSKSTELNYKSEREFYISLMYFFRKHKSYINYLLLKCFYFIKLFRKFYKDKRFLKLSFFVLRGAPQKYSLRFEQKMKSE